MLKSNDNYCTFGGSAGTAAGRLVGVPSDILNGFLGMGVAAAVAGVPTSTTLLLLAAVDGASPVAFLK